MQINVAQPNTVHVVTHSLQWAHNLSFSFFAMRFVISQRCPVCSQPKSVKSKMTEGD